jgi:carbamoyl-phosphate synthase small subunit
MRAYLVLDTGETFPGQWLGRPIEAKGEVVFTTSMTGYQEALTNPSYAGQVITFTYPLIGNCGVIPEEVEGRRPLCAGVVMSEVYDGPGGSLGQWLTEQGVPAIVGVDTRAVVKRVRDRRLVRGVISSSPHPSLDDWPDPQSLEWVSRATVKKPLHYPGGEGAFHIVMIDLGAKASLLNALRRKGWSVTVVPYHWDPDKIREMEPDGLLLSNGPGDPKALKPFLPAWVPLFKQIPTLGICLGHQLLALALGGDTERLAHGHRGSNHPVRECATGRIWITSQNHGYAVREDSLDPGEWEVTCRHVNDGTVEGISHRFYPVLGVQFHPESHPGSTDEATLLDYFASQVWARKKVQVHD